MGRHILGTRSWHPNDAVKKYRGTLAAGNGKCGACAATLLREALLSSMKNTEHRTWNAAFQKARKGDASGIG
jgi:hypothetical protein